MKEFKKQFPTDNYYNNAILSSHDYEIKKNAVIDQYEYVDGVLIPDGKRQLNATAFAFGSLIQTKQ